MQSTAPVGPMSMMIDIQHLPSDVTVDALAGRWRIHQRQRGHRWSIDDLLTAHVACIACPHPSRHLDLGCGIGSVLMLCTWKMREGACQHVGIEAQEQSVTLCRASLALNAITDRVQVRHADFRDSQALSLDERFDLVTGTPPYVPVGTGAIPRDPQRAGARIELRGGIEAYCAVAAAHLGHDGVAVLCGDGRRLERTEKAANSAALHIHEVHELIPHPDKGPLFHVVVVRATPCQRVQHSRVLARDEHGRRTAEMQRIRADFDMPPSEEDAQAAAGEYWDLETPAGRP